MTIIAEMSVTSAKTPERGRVSTGLRTILTRLLRSRWLYAAGIVLVFGLVLAPPVPFHDEFFYLLTPFRQWHPAFLRNDWTFSAPSLTHVVFNWVAGLPMLVLPPEKVGWIGRILCWLALAAGLVRIGDAFRLPRLASSFVVLLWLGMGQAVVGEPRMFAEFEARAVAYVFLVYAIAWFLEGRDRRGWIALGLCIDFHAAIGVTAFPAVVFALLLTGYEWRRALRWSSAALVIALPSLVPALLVPGGADRSAWRFAALVAEPSVLNPLSFPLRDLLILGAMLAYLVVRSLSAKQDRVLRFCGFLALGMACVFAFGFIARLTGRYGLLRITPFRLLPLFGPLLFLFAVLHGGPKGGARAWIFRLWALAVVMMMANPVNAAIDWRAWLRAGGSQYSADDAVAANFRWIKGHTPADAVIVAPPWRTDEWFRGHRAQIAVWWVPVYEELPEWRRRIVALAGSLDANAFVGLTPNARAASLIDKMMATFNALPVDSVLSIQRRYGGDYLVSSGAYPFRRVFQAGRYKTYELPHVEPAAKKPKAPSVTAAGARRG